MYIIYLKEKNCLIVILTAAIEGLLTPGDGCVTSTPISIQSLFFKRCGLKKKERKIIVQKY